MLTNHDGVRLWVLTTRQTPLLGLGLFVDTVTDVVGLNGACQRSPVLQFPDCFQCSVDKKLFDNPSVQNRKGLRLAPESRKSPSLTLR
jgi:hypothetical protein